jgi:hypothetical protein
MYRAMGCIQNFAVHIPNIAIAPYVGWDLSRDAAPALLIELSELDDDKNDDDVTVTLDKPFDASQRDANGNALADLTMRVDPDSRSRTSVKGKVKDGVLTTAPFNMQLVADPTLMPMFEIKNARLRFTIKEDGRLEGFLGGYLPWEPIYWTYAQGGWIIEHAQGIDMPGLYYALKKMADADPDPKTGLNNSISTTWWIGAAPAIIKHSERASAQTSK